MKRGALAGISMIAVVSGCDLIEPGADIWSVWAEVRGTVRLASGAPVANAQIQMELMHDGPGVGGEVTCQRVTGAVAVRLTTSSDGRFSNLFDDVSIDVSECLELTVTPPSGVGAAVVVDTLLMRWSRKRDAAPVIEASIVLPPSSH